ncbi:RidA family protein [Streptomyces sp. NPDC088350]|uniref:RidA family protein n=1 Tax=Streptomyces sp. NPDC088350 TaxID=3365854 RepID=UPI00382DA359
MNDRANVFVANEPALPVSLSAAAVGTPTVFTAGQVGLNPATGRLAEGFEAQVEQAIDNLESVLLRSGSGLDRVLKATCYLADLSQFAIFEAIYARRFPQPYPARTTLGAVLVSGILFEVEAIATVGG